MGQRADIVIVVPPFAMASYPTLGPSVLEASCRDLGLTAEILYANLLFAARVGFERYETIATSSVRSLVGEAIFRGHAFPGTGERIGGAIETAFGDRSAIGSSRSPAGVTQEDAAACRREIDGFLDEAIDRVLELRPKIVGVSTVFQQNLASIAMVRLLKARAPQVLTVLGGGNVAEPMGSALAGVVEECDLVFSGEADFEFPRFCSGYLDGESPPADRVIECASVFDLDATTPPDYSSYYTQVRELVAERGLPPNLPTWLHFESSRGCWYGAKSHCKFCGLNGSEIAYRKKSADRILEEIRQTVARHNPKCLSATDNIMPIQFRQEVLPRLEAENLGIRIFYEVKANLREADLDQFVRAGVTMIQPGIESLSSNVLKRMAKGVSAIQNIWLLRECRSRGIEVYWNILTGIPGETAHDYESILELMPMLEHLRPPAGKGDIRLDRFSPYFVLAEDHGIENVRPNDIYRSLYPAAADIHAIAYHFTGDYSTELLADEKLETDLETAIEKWRNAWQGDDLPPRLFALHLGEDHVLIQDSRSCAVAPFFVASRTLKQLLVDLERPVRRDRLREASRREIGVLLDHRFVIEHEGFLVSVVTEPAKEVALRRPGTHTSVSEVATVA